MKTIIKMFIVALFVIPFGATNAQNLTKDMAELHREYAAVKKSDARLVPLLKEQGPKLVSMRHALEVRNAEYAASRAKYDAASDAYAAECKVFFPKQAVCKKEKARLAQWQESLKVERDRAAKHKAALLKDEWYYATRQAIHQENLRIMTCIEAHSILQSGKSLPKGKMGECFQPTLARAQ